MSFSAYVYRGVRRFNLSCCIGQVTDKYAYSGKSQVHGEMPLIIRTEHNMLSMVRKWIDLADCLPPKIRAYQTRAMPIVCR